MAKVAKVGKVGKRNLDAPRQTPKESFGDRLAVPRPAVKKKTAGKK